MIRRWLLLPFWLGCGEAVAPPDAPCLPPNRLAGERCLEPGVQDDGCPAGTTGQGNGTCRAAGVPPVCPTGFTHDGDVCAPILPPVACRVGQLAVPGEGACHSVLPCRGGKWGEQARDADTEHVDASYRGASDGSAAQPWITIGEAVAAAAPGALVLVAAGTYPEDVVLSGKPLRLWGVCTDAVAIAGQGVERGAVNVLALADGSEVGGLALTGPRGGIVVNGAADVVVDRVWVHDAAATGIYALAPRGVSSLSVTDTLVERCGDYGVYASGSTVALERIVVRDTLAGEQLFGRGINFRPEPDTNAPVDATVRTSLIERNLDIGVAVSGGSAELEGVVVRDTAPTADGLRGFGLAVSISQSSGTASNVTVRGSLIERSHDIGVAVIGSTVALDGVAVRDTAPRASDLLSGRGIAIEADPDSGASAAAALSGVLVERSHELGIYLGGTAATLDAVWVRDTRSNVAESRHGIGIVIERDQLNGVPGSAVLRGGRIDQSHEQGVLVVGAQAELVGVLVTRTEPSGIEVFGDALSVIADGAPAGATIESCRFEDSHRAGISNFGGVVSLARSALQCQALDLDGEPFAGSTFAFDDRGSNGCGCPSPVGECHAVSTGLAAPAAID